MVEFASPGWLWLLALAPAALVMRARSRLAESRSKRLAGVTLRCVAFVALVLALAGPLERSVPRHADVVFALDVSRSVGREAAERGLELVNRAFAAKDPEARMGLVAFAADAVVEVLLARSVHPVETIAADVPRDDTDVAKALEVAMGAFPSGAQRRVVLLSDGRDTLGDAASAAAVARSIGVEIVAVPLAGAAARDAVQVGGITVPSRVRVHEPFEVMMALHARRPVRADLVIMRNGALLHGETVDLEPGRNAVTIVEQVTRPGLYEYEAILNSDDDDLLENNRFQAFVQVSGAPRVLHATGEAGAAGPVGEALRAQGLVVDALPASALPATMHRLADYDLVILDNVSGFDLSLAKMELLEEYVRDAGGGLIAIGGDASYSAGGYHGTPVERLLPVTMDVKTDVKIPTLAVVVVLDKSGSMSSSVQGEEKLAIAKLAALSAIEVLNPLDRVGVLAFDAGHEWAVELTEVGDRRAIVDELRTLGAGGGTNLHLALDEAHRVVAAVEAKVKHLIVLSDGLTDVTQDFDGQVQAIAADGITVSTVAFGLDADRTLLARIAALGRGRAYRTEDPHDVPRIFTSETMVVSRGLVVERPVQPALLYPGEMIRGFAAADFPPLAGYQRTFPKPAAQVLLGADEDDPLLVSWRYGLGKSVAFMSDLSGRWSREWLRWPEFGRFIAQAARWSMRRTGTETIEPTFTWRGRHGEIVVDVLDRDDRFVNGLAMQATVTDPERATRRVTLEQIAPGRYRGAFEVPRIGRYYVNLSGTDGDLRVGPKTFGLAVPYSAEFIGTGVDEARLAELTGATGGRVLALAPDPLAELLAPHPDAAVQSGRVWRPLVLTALLALLLEIAIRKLVLPRAWRERLGRGAAADDASDDDAAAGEAELRAGIARMREAHLEALRGGRGDADDPSARARLYVARRRVG